MNELLGGGGCRCKSEPGALAESRSGKARTRICEFSGRCNRSDSVSRGRLTAPTTVSEAGQRHACDARARHMNLAEEATCRQPDRSAVSTEAGKVSIGKQSNQTLFCRLTPELSRPVAGRRTRASVAQSTRLTPRHGVGLNELLGGGGCRPKRTSCTLAERRSGKARPRTCELTAGCTRSDRIRCGKLTKNNHCFRSCPSQRMRCMSAPDGLDRRSNAPTILPKRSTHRSR